MKFLSIKIFIYAQYLFYLFKFNLMKVSCNIRYKKNKFDIDIKKLKKNGYILIENYFSKDECKNLIAIIDEFLINNQDKVWNNFDNTDFRVFGINNIGNQFVSLFYEDENFQKIGEQYIGCKLRNIFTMSGKIIGSENNIGSGGGWHRDSIQPVFKSMIYLNDVDKLEYGAFQIINDSNRIKNIAQDHYFLKKLDLLNTRFEETQITKLIEKYNYKISSILGKAGTVILFDGSYIHRGSPISSNSRYALTNYYFPKNRAESNLKNYKPLIKKN